MDLLQISGRFVSPDAHYSELESAHPKQILSWTASTIDRLAVATSFQSSGLVILHLLRDIRSDLPVLFLDTGWHFPETLEFRQSIAQEWDLNLVDLHGEHETAARQDEVYGKALYRRDPNMCCHINKVKPLQKALENFDGWISGLRRDQSPLRAHTPVIEAQMLPSGNEVLKIHPLANWSKADVEGYVGQHDIPTHPLLERNFGSIGCWPCTRPLEPGESERAGRWDGNKKMECGIHTFGSNGGPVETEAEQ